MTSFALQLAQFAEKVGEDADQVVGGVVIELARVIDERSPVGDAKFWKSSPPKGYVGGHFRANWQLAIGSIPKGEVVGINFGAALAENVARIPTEAAGPTYYLANNVPYAQRLEDGWSRQAPVGLVGRTVIEFQDIVARKVAEVTA
ncbi:MAG: hypothetical protein ACKVOB_13485 [Sphingomonas sp.]